jgi:hypothetical protein
MEWSGVRIQWRQEIVFSKKRRKEMVWTGSGANPASSSVGIGVKEAGFDADHPPPSSANVKIEWSYTTTPIYAYMA